MSEQTVKEEAKGDADVTRLKTRESNSRLSSLPWGFPLFLLCTHLSAVDSSPYNCVLVSLERVHSEVANQQQGLDNSDQGTAAAAAAFLASFDSTLA